MKTSNLQLPTNPSESFKRRNPHLFQFVNLPAVKEGKRIRQSSKPLLNKLEFDYKQHLEWQHGKTIHAQAWRVRLANGAWFKVDLCGVIDGQWTAWECKGPKQMKNVDRGMLALKCAASQFPDVDWYLVWREDGHIWKTQRVFP